MGYFYDQMPDKIHIIVLHYEHSEQHFINYKKCLNNQPITAQGAKDKNLQFNFKFLFIFNPLVPDAHYSEGQDKPFSLHIPQL